MADTVIKQEIIEDLPFPGQIDTASETNSTSADGVISTPQTKKIDFPDPVIAREVISSSFNSQSKRILSEFTFNESGAIAIGHYEAGVSGDVRISPNGIIGRNKDGVNTFTLDATTGDATFLGVLAAGSLIAGNYFAVLEDTNRRGIFINDGTYDVIFMGIEIS